MLKPVPPLLAITGALDARVPPEHLKFYERVPGSEVAIIDGAGHSPMVEKPAKTLELIRQFLRSAPLMFVKAGWDSRFVPVHGSKKIAHHCVARACCDAGFQPR